MQNTILTLQIIVSILLVIAILVQNKGGGFGRVWGSSGSGSYTRRGLERLVFRSTFVLVLLFVILSLSLLFV